ncbi:helix-turn-helix domain-containing protein [Streptomyces sp. 891-h]|uniref:helix-turn-helix domain-containing protein n=1 Tax=Streptomyces sp. 891-h TaxID=2720714 RepID=UPI001FA947FC|nr:helix-turn-helix domain-containing protein [Streptomyces sp. 891-h]UNZ21807.1 helix-turn-helix domain-containing protein [Streptomyces sp. 891-h]
MPPAFVHHRPSTESQASLPRLYRPEEIAEALGCSAWWVKDRAKRGLIPHARIGRAYRFTAGHLDEIIRFHEECPTRSAGNAATVAAAFTPPAARTHAVQPPRPTTTPTKGRLRARPPRRTRYKTVA